MAAFPRRFLPPMSQLCAFESAARHQSFTAAAAELSLTQSAVSRLVRALEETLGSQLFAREKQTVKLTMAGEAYAEEIRRSLRQISTATLGFRANPQGGVLNLAILPTFGSRWLAPRLRRFAAKHPEVTLSLTTRLKPFEFQNDRLDAAIHFGVAEWPGARLDFLMNETVVPACSPSLLHSLSVTGPDSLLRAPLLHLDSRPDAWQRWFSAFDIDCSTVPGMFVDQFAVATQAAVAGLGVALLPEFLIQEELASGQLVVAIEKPVESLESYYLAWPVGRDLYPPLATFRRWLLEESASHSDHT